LVISFSFLVYIGCEFRVEIATPW